MSSAEKMKISDKRFCFSKACRQKESLSNYLHDLKLLVSKKKIVVLGIISKSLNQMTDF